MSKHMNVLAVDPGHFGTKIATEAGVKVFNSGVCEIKSIEDLDGKQLESGFTSHSHVVSIGGKLHVVGQYAAKMNRTKKLKKDKDNQEAYVRILTQVALFVLDTGQSNIVLATLNPIGATTKKNVIKDTLRGEHVVIIDNQTVRFEIERVEVLNEGSISVLAFEDDIDVDNFTIIDVGSSTINVADFYDFEYIHANSKTVPAGVETFRNKVDKQVDYDKLIAYVEEIVDEIVHLKQKVYFITGDMTLFDRIEHNNKLRYPNITYKGNRVNTTFCNVIGAYYAVCGE